MSPARVAPNENVVAPASRLTAKLVTSRSGLPLPTKLGRMSPTASTTEAALAGEAAMMDKRATANGNLFMGVPPALLAPSEEVSVRRAGAGSRGGSTSSRQSCFNRLVTAQA